ncbi:hypothetical protein [Ideonella sp. BN130291]|uniref:hypothetical protein n=1 Tax=Ideonella sp. BN130291 TaxID=3112940 RepID=UPI002E26E5E1|nr:hypothetical protein [Ideonella sp. BN130291]
MSAPSTIVKLGVGAVAVPVVGFLVGLLLQFVIPGCKCDEGAGCSGCGPLNDTLALLVLGGFVGALLAAFVVLPAALLLAGILQLISGGKD